MKIITATLIIILIALSCTPESEDTNHTATLLADQELENTTINFTREGIKQAVLWANHLSKYKKVNLIKGQEIKITFYDSTEAATTFLTSDSGRINEKTEEIMVWGEVEVETQDNVKLWTNSLTWDPETQLIETDDYVKIKKGTDLIEGVGLISDINFNDIRIKKNVKAKIFSED